MSFSKSFKFKLRTFDSDNISNAFSIALKYLEIEPSGVSFGINEYLPDGAQGVAI